MFTKEESRKKIQELTESFEGKIDFIKTSGDYKEAQIEDEFIKPLFRYLNWNISNEGIQNPSEREFIVQAKGRNGKEPDYLLQLDQKPKFYVEAKHTKYDLQKRTDYIWQAYSYSYSTQSLSASKKVDFALLTDFEEFRFFDCTFPVKDNSILNNYCVIDWTYKDYITKFDELWDYFEKENVRKDSFAGGATSRPTLYLNEKKIKANRIPPDKAFLNDLDNEESGWRITLAKDIKKYQPEFSSEFITQSVQLILDRFIFIKVLSDREIEEEIIKQIVNRIQKEETSAHSVFEECKDIFHDLDKTYNGSIFAERAELDSVKVGNKTLVGILKDFLPENSRYNFKVIPVEILGTIYEQFLGKVVTTTDKRAKIEYKPEVRKAGGVYYTPDYIVNYIVEKTVGEKLKECKTIDDLLEIKICDPACGSGSFLIAAYDALIQWTISYYKNKKLTREEQKTVYTDSNGDIRLTSKIKRDILRSCIYGVDIDAQAVEVTKMSLSLKALENTTHYEVHQEVTLFHVCVLPPLEGNIMCGNSLVETDFYEERLLLSDYEEKQINAFSWSNSFSDIFKKGKFDCIIGNPPYGAAINDKIEKYLMEKFSKTYEYQVNSFVLFIEQGFNILKNNGKLGLIIPGVLLTQHYFSKVRHFLLSNFQLNYIALCRYKVFEQAETAETISFAFSKNTSLNNINYFIANNYNEFGDNEYITVSQQKFFEANRYEMNLLSSSKKEINLKKKPVILLSEIAIPIMGIKPYQVGKGSPKQTRKTVDERIFDASKQKNKTYKQYIIGKDITRYKIEPKEIRYISYGVHLAEPRQTAPFEDNEKIVIRQTADKIIAALDTNKYYNLNNVYNIALKDKAYDLKYLLGLLNSKLFIYHYRSIVPEEGRVFAEIKKVNLEKLYIRSIDFKKKEEEILYKDLVANVDLLINEKMKVTQTTSDSTRIEQKITHLDNKIDSLVYQLYDLTPEEINIVEGDNG
ncbi:MAG: N-6 DNA methylase [Leptospiraceae bacterium]|nr:N-6 DNA methylase [Leptospiraceae bacterium]